MIEVVSERRCLVCDERVWWGDGEWADHDHSDDAWAEAARMHEAGDHSECRSGACHRTSPATEAERLGIPEAGGEGVG